MARGISFSEDFRYLRRMTYSVKEIFYSLQGEGARSGRPAVFCRFAGCNLWSGLEKDREGADCDFCDTDFVGTDGEGGGKFASAEALADAIIQFWPEGKGQRYVVFTGGEPLLQLDEDLVARLHNAEFAVAVETNGTLPIVFSLDWVCVSPKAGQTLAVTEGDELKLIFPQSGLAPPQVEGLAFRHFYLQAMDGPMASKNREAAVNYCLENPTWKLSLQSHKLLGIR